MDAGRQLHDARVLRYGSAHQCATDAGRQLHDVRVLRYGSATVRAGCR